MSEAQLLLVRVFVRDVTATAWFYREAFGVAFEPAETADPGTAAVWRDAAGLRLELAQARSTAVPKVELGFSVEDLAAAHARAVAAGAEVVRPPGEERLGATAVYRDRDGNVVMLTQRSGAVRVAGVDLVRGALAVVVLEDLRVADVFRCDSFAEALLVEARVIGVDVPIGIPAHGPRAADEAVRRFLGRGAAGTATPVRATLDATGDDGADARHAELAGRSSAAPSTALRERILELDEYARDDSRVIEVHPEVSYRELSRGPLTSKHRAHGLLERRALLEQAGIELPASAPRIAEPELLDATIAAWSARRYALGQALPLPQGATSRIGVVWR